MGKNKVVFGDAVIMDISDTTAEPQDVSEGETFYDNGGNRQVGTGRWMEPVEDPTANEVLITDANGQAIGSGVLIGNVVKITDIATETTLGIIKLNPSQNITLNENNQLEVGGRIGQFEGTTGLFAPNNRDPRYVNDYSLLITDALGIDMQANRALAIVSGMSITVRSAAPGTTVYYAENTYNNRILAKVCEGGYVSRDEATSKVETIIPVSSVLINGATFYPDSSPDDPNNPIVITLAETANPDTTITQLRMFGAMNSYATAHIGNGVRSGPGSGGRSLEIGGGVTKESGNDHCMVGQYLYTGGNGNALLGRYIIARKNRGFFTGTGHDGTNARAEAVAAMGQWSLITPKTLLALGNGTSHTNRSNAFEVTDTETKIDNIVATAKQIVFDSGDYDNLAPALVAANWGTNANWSFADEVLTFNGVSGALNCSAKAALVTPVTAGETLTVSFEAKKATADGAIGNLQINLLKTNSSGGSATNNIVVNKPASDFTAEWATYTATFTVPSGMEYFLPRITKANGTVTSGQNYQVRNFVVGRPMDKGAILTSPNGTKYKLVVDDSGTVSTTPVT